jgi:hypothetical protein
MRFAKPCAELGERPDLSVDLARWGGGDHAEPLSKAVVLDQFASQMLSERSSL